MRQLEKLAFLAAVLLPCYETVHAQDSGLTPEVVTIEGTRIQGDQEVPTVMYLVPWQPPKVGELRAPDEQLMVEQAFAPLERYDFQRLVRYHDAFIDKPAAAERGN
ncbi:hypothetical protein [Marinobacter sp. ANT_B65]|uniref:hypothetical protein n=1 Tax=Marinobacter sp. ANT_B65 TaxID=2039467 RepID=UPI000BBE7ED0|nr:hypothetical protein [Marinobacter sp. ANT_B65]PCM45488.1 hypothetical protein CPA50_05735 [Marinobacter sp. ANT_B65]